MDTNGLASQDIIGRDLLRICPQGVGHNVDLRDLSRWRIGGKAAWFVEPATVEQVSGLVRYAGHHDIPIVVIGDGSNLLFDDAGLDALAIRIGRLMSSVRVIGNTVMSQAGVWVPRLAHKVANAGLCGLQHTIGIPGTLGGLICMNGGSQRHGIGENIEQVTAVMPDGAIEVFTHEQCDFAYRQSVFQSNSGIVVEACLRFDSGNRREMCREMINIMRSRRERFPLKLPNCGSVFVSNPKMYASVGPPGKAIEDAGLKGLRIGDAQSSTQHANFIVNLGHATSRDVLMLIERISTVVFKKTGFVLECEVRHVNYHGVVCAAHEILSEKNLIIPNGE